MEHEKEIFNAQKEKKLGFLSSHIAPIIVSIVSVSGIIISSAQYYSAYLENERQWKVDAANFIAENQDKIFNKDRDIRKAFIRLAKSAFPADVVEPITKDLSLIDVGITLESALCADADCTSFDPKALSVVKSCMADLGMEKVMLTDLALDPSLLGDRQRVIQCLAEKDF